MTRDRRAAAGLAATALALASACGPDSADVPYLRATRCSTPECADAAAPADGGTTQIPYEPLEPWSEEPGPLGGVFAVEAIVKARAVLEVEARQLFRLRIAQSGTTLRQKTTLCKFLLPSVEGVAELELPARLEQVLREKPVEATGEFLSRATTVGAEYQPAPSDFVVGTSAGFGEPLPTEEDRSRAVDEDADGQPGVTLLAQTITCDQPEALFVALRTRVRLDGVVISRDRIEGDVEVELEQSVVGYADPCLAVAAGIAISVLPGSTFAAVRTLPEEDLNGDGNVGCEELLRSAPSRFGDAWSE